MFLLYLQGVLALTYECDGESCTSIADSSDWIVAAPNDFSLDSLLSDETQDSTHHACGMCLSKDLWAYNGITGAQVKYCDVRDDSVKDTEQTAGFSSSSNELLTCDPGYFIDGIQAKFQQHQTDDSSASTGINPMELQAIGQLYSTFESSGFYDQVSWNQP